MRHRFSTMFDESVREVAGRLGPEARTRSLRSLHPAFDVPRFAFNGT
jgi:hypothetical protein